MFSVFVLTQLGLVLSLVVTSFGLVNISGDQLKGEGSVTLYVMSPTPERNACLRTDGPDDYSVALPSNIVNDFPNADRARPNPICNRRVKVTNADGTKSIVAKAGLPCERCKGKDIALSAKAFAALGATEGTTTSVKWSFLEPNDSTPPGPLGKPVHPPPPSSSSPIPYPRRGVLNNGGSGTAAASLHKFARRSQARSESIHKRGLEGRGQGQETDGAPKHRMERRRFVRDASEVVTRVL